MKKNLLKSLSLLFAFFVALNIFSGIPKALASVPPKGLEITEVMDDSSAMVNWIEIKNQQTKTTDISGFSITATKKHYLYPANSDISFQIPAQSIFILTNSVQKFKQATNKENLIAIQVDELKLPSRGSIEIRDSFDVLIDTFSYAESQQNFDNGYSLESSVQENKVTPSIEKNGTPGEAYNLSIKQNVNDTAYENKITEIQMTDFSIQDITTNQAKISWTTGVPTIGKVFYGKDEANLNQISVEQNPLLFHSITISNLEPNSIYFVRISSERNGKAEFSRDMHQLRTKEDPSSILNQSFEEQLFSPERLTDYDQFDAVFLKIPNFAENSKLNIQNNNVEPIENSDISMEQPFEGMKAASILVLLFISFFLAKYFLRLKNRLKYNLN